MGPTGDALALELVEVSPGRHRRDQELGFERRHRHASLLEQPLSDQHAGARPEAAARSSHTRLLRRSSAEWRPIDA